jgi:hypothetical protein
MFLVTIHYVDLLHDLDTLSGAALAQDSQSVYVLTYGTHMQKILGVFATQEQALAQREKLNLPGRVCLQVNEFQLGVVNPEAVELINSYLKTNEFCASPCGRGIKSLD